MGEAAVASLGHLLQDAINSPPQCNADVYELLGSDGYYYSLLAATSGVTYQQASQVCEQLLGMELVSLTATATASATATAVAATTVRSSATSTPNSSAVASSSSRATATGTTAAASAMSTASNSSTTASSADTSATSSSSVSNETRRAAKWLCGSKYNEDSSKRCWVAGGIQSTTAMDGNSTGTTSGSSESSDEASTALRALCPAASALGPEGGIQATSVDCEVQLPVLCRKRKCVAECRLAVQNLIA